MWKGLGTNLKSGLNGLTSTSIKKSSKKNTTSNPNDIFSAEEASGVSPIRLNTSRPKHLKKAQKGDETSPIPVNYSPKTSGVQGSENLEPVRCVTRSLPDLSEKEMIETSRPTDLKDEVDEIWGIPSPAIKKGKETRAMMIDTEIEELRVSLQIKEQALGQFVEDNEKLIKERNELKEQIQRLQGGDSTGEGMKKYIEECIGQYKTEIAEQVMEEVNKEILQQIGEEEGDLSEDVKKMINVFGVKPEMVKRVTDNAVPVEKIVKSLCDEEELGILKGKIEEKEEEIKQLKERLRETEESRSKDEGALRAFEQEIEEYKMMIQAKGQDIERVIIESEAKDAQIKTLEERLSTESLVNGEFRTKYEDIVNENNRLSTELAQHMNKENEQYNSQAQELDKMQEKCASLQSENGSLTHQNLELIKAIDSLNTTIASQEEKIITLKSELAGHQEIEDKYLEEMTLRTEEIELLKGKLNKMKEELDGTNAYVNKLENEIGVVPELNSKIETQQAQITALNELVTGKDQEIETLNGSITELRAVSEDNKQVKENEGAYEELKARYEMLEKENMEYKEKLNEKDNEETVKEKNQDENLVDKRILSTFLLKYFDGNASYSVKHGIMETMASLLGFSHEERVKVGLIKVNPLEEEEEKIDEKEKANMPQKSLKQMFMSFLQDE